MSNVKRAAPIARSPPRRFRSPRVMVVLCLSRPSGKLIPIVLSHPGPVIVADSPLPHSAPPPTAHHAGVAGTGQGGAGRRDRYEPHRHHACAGIPKAYWRVPPVVPLGYRRKCPPSLGLAGVSRRHHYPGSPQTLRRAYCDPRAGDRERARRHFCRHRMSRHAYRLLPYGPRFGAGRPPQNPARVFHSPNSGSRWLARSSYRARRSWRVLLSRSRTAAGRSRACS
jgi:hypothetical protein